MVVADLVNTVLSDYGNATGSSFDLTNMSNMAGMAGAEMGLANNNVTAMAMGDQQLQMSANSIDDNMAMEANSTTSSMSNMTTTNIVDEQLPECTIYLKQHYLTVVH